MTNSNPAEGILAAARKLQEDKLSALSGLVDASGDIARITAELAEAQKGYGAAYKVATDAGWTERELKSVGVAAPLVRAAGRPRGNGRGRAPAGGSALADAQLRREAEASTRLDGETQTLGVPDQVGNLS